VISSAHSLAHSTQQHWQGEAFKDLRPRSQVLAIAAHFVWFVLFIISSLWPALLKLTY
jgi:hypothetical protein